MTKIRMFGIAAPAVMVAFGVYGQAAFAQDSAISKPQLHMATIGRVQVGPDDVPDAASQVHQGITGMGVLPPQDTGGVDEWPCFGGGGDADCSTIALGGLVIGTPVYTWPLTACTSNTAACGQIFWTFETDIKSTTAPINVSITVTQGTTTKTTIASLSGNVGANPGAGFIEIISADVAFGPGDCGAGTCGTPVQGPATIKVTTKIGTSTATGSAVILLK